MKDLFKEILTENHFAHWTALVFIVCEKFGELWVRKRTISVERVQLLVVGKIGLKFFIGFFGEGIHNALLINTSACGVD